MSHSIHLKHDTFLDIIDKIGELTFSQQKFLKEILSSAIVKAEPQNSSLLQKSFGLWRDRNEITNSIDYVNSIRKEWNSRVEY